MASGQAERAFSLTPEQRESNKTPWWKKSDPTFPIHVEPKFEPIPLDETGGEKVRVYHAARSSHHPPPTVPDACPLSQRNGFVIQREYSGSWREHTAEQAVPKPNTISTLSYSMHQTDAAYVFHVDTHWEHERAQYDFDTVETANYRTVGYIYVTGPRPRKDKCARPDHSHASPPTDSPHTTREPAASLANPLRASYPYDGPRGEKDLNRGRISLPRGADLEACARKEFSVEPWRKTGGAGIRVTVPKRAGAGPTAEYVDPDQTGRARNERLHEEMRRREDAHCRGETVGEPAAS